jgi:hypothetical protein
MTDPDQPKRGRPPVDVDMNVLEALAWAGCTNIEIAARFGVSERTIEMRRREAGFRAVMERGVARGNISLRQKQMSEALRGNTTMLIWMGKQRLGQKDKTELSGEVKTTPPKIHVHFVSPKAKGESEVG